MSCIHSKSLNLKTYKKQGMASSGKVCIDFIIQHIHNDQLIRTLTHHMASRSKVIRCAMCNFLDQVILTWPKHILEKHVTLLHRTVNNGIQDIDEDVRTISQK